MTKKSVSVILICALIAIMVLGLVACNPSDSKYTIVYVGDSIAEALIGPSPLSERDNYGYYALVGKTNNFRYYNHSVSGHKTSTGIVSNEGLKEVLMNDDENASLMKTHLKQANMIHISVLGNNLLQYNLGLMMLEVADPQFEAKYAAAKNGTGEKTLINALEEGSLEHPLTRKSVEKFKEDGSPETVEFAFPPTYQDISDIVDRLKSLNPKATIVFQKVYNPFFEGSKHLSEEVMAELAKITDVDGRFGKAGDKITTIEQVRSLADYLLDRLNGILDMYLAEHEGAFITLDAKAAFEQVVQRDTNDDGSVNLGGDSIGRSLIYEDWTHPSNFGHAIIAGMTQDLLDELKVSSPNAVANYKAIRVDQINRLFKTVQGFNAQQAIDKINAAKTYFDVTIAYFEAIDGLTPTITSDGFKTDNAKTSFAKNMRFKLDVNQLGLMDIDLINAGTLSMLSNLIVDKENSYAEFTTDGQMHFQIKTKAGVFGELMDNIFSMLKTFNIDIDKNTVNEMLSTFDIEGGVDSMVEPMFPGFKAKLRQGDLDGALKIIQNSLGFYIDGLDYSNDNVKAILNHVAQTMKLPSNLLDLIPADTQLTLSFDSQYFVKNVKGSDGKTYQGIYISAIGANSDTQPFCIFNMTKDSKTGKNLLFYRVQFMNLKIGFVEC